MNRQASLQASLVKSVIAVHLCRADPPVSGDDGRWVDLVSNKLIGPSQ
jgi:hypothetical protein